MYLQGKKYSMKITKNLNLRFKIMTKKSQTPVIDFDKNKNPLGFGYDVRNF